jgi:hypothetical protein
MEATSTEEDLQEDWNVLRPKPLVQRIDSSGSLLSGLDIAVTKTLEDTRIEASRSKSTLIVEAVSRLVEFGARRLFHHFTTDLKQRDTVNLIEIVLSDHALSIDELKGFVRALPQTLLKRIVIQGAAMESVHGIHGLLAIELAHRESSTERDYTLRKIGNTLEVTLYPTHLNGKAVTFTLDENFDLESSEHKDGT